MILNQTEQDKFYTENWMLQKFCDLIESPNHQKKWFRLLRNDLQGLFHKTFQHQVDKMDSRPLGFVNTSLHSAELYSKWLYL
jgi:hypothetical protein